MSQPLAAKKTLLVYKGMIVRNNYLFKVKLIMVSVGKHHKFFIVVI